MKYSALLLAVAFVASAGSAESKYAKYYQNLPTNIAQVEEVKISSKQFSVLDFGAKADGKTLNTKAIQKAIDTVSKTGGHLDFPAGTYLTGPIELKSRVDLHLEKGALIQFSPDKTLYLKPDGKTVRHCIYAKNCANISITGEGIIDGSGSYWWGIARKMVTKEYWNECLARGGVVENSKRGESWFPYGLKDGTKCIGSDYKEQEKLRNSYIFRPEDSKNVLVDGVTFRNSPKMAFFPTRIENLIIDGLKVEAPVFAPNTDAIDISVCRKVLIVNCVLDCGDDGFIMKGGNEGNIQQNKKFGDFSDILISDCHTLNSHCGFGLGSENVHGIKNVVVKNCVFENATMGGVEFKTPAGRGGITKNIWCYDIEIRNARNAVLFNTAYEDKGMLTSATGKDDRSKFLPDLQDIHFKNIKATGTTRHAIQLFGLSEKNPVHDLTFENCAFESDGDALNFTFAKNIAITDSSFKTADNAISKSDTEFVTFKNTTVNGAPFEKNIGSLVTQRESLTLFDFSKNTDGVSEKESNLREKEILPQTGNGASLTLSGRFSKISKELAANKISNLTEKSFSSANLLTLKLKKDSEISISFHGAGSSDTQMRFLVLASAENTALESKGNLEAKNTTVTARLPKGTYKIFTNGTRISFIEVNATE